MMLYGGEALWWSVVMHDGGGGDSVGKIHPGTGNIYGRHRMAAIYSQFAEARTCNAMCIQGWIQVCVCVCV